MIEMMRPVVNFLNQLDKEVEEYTRERSPLLKYVASAQRVSTDRLTGNRNV
jgi:hypothetical protein